jgi:hypothetical protein
VPSIRVIEAHDSQSVAQFSEVFVGANFIYGLEITALGADSVKVALDRDAYVDPQLSLSQTIAGVRPQPFRGFPVGADGKATARMGALLEEDLTIQSGPYPVALKLTVVTGGVETVHRLRAPDLRVTGLRRFTLTRTAEVAALLGFQLYVPPSLPYPYACEGESTGTAGTFPVGVGERNGDVTFTVRSGPIGTHCSWETQNTVNPNHPWKIEAMNFSQTTTGSCRIGGDEDDLRRDPPSSGTIRHNEIFIGKFPRQSLRDLNQSRIVFPIMHVGLGCQISGTNDRVATFRWDSIELVGPDNQSVDEAFRR